MLKRLVIDGYGQLELNQVAFRRDGRIEAQCKLANGIDFVENGMLLEVDPIKREVKLPAANSGLIALNYSAEHIYDERTPGLKNFKLEKNSFLPRLGYLSVGDKFTTNCISYDTDTYATETLLKAAIANAANAAVYGEPATDGSIKIVNAAPEGSVSLKVVGATTMPDGQYAVKFISLK